MARHVVIGTAGHIDHGKSALVRALTGTDPDRLKEERERGITIDLGFAHLQTDDATMAFVDVPGHERFVKNMLAGASGVDAVLLVIAADESVMPQTREHFDICRLLGVSVGVVALTKTDLVDDDTVELVKLETAELVAGSFLENAPVVPVSARSGSGLEEVRQALSGVTDAAASRRSGGAVRLPIDRAFSVKGFGTVVTGTLVSGQLWVDDACAILPTPRAVKVRGLQVHGSSNSTAVAGQRVAVNLTGVDVSEIRRGDTLVTADAFEETARLDAVVELLGSARRLRHGARVRFHQGTAEILGRVALGPGLDELADVSEVLGELPPGGRAFGRLRLEHHAVLTRGDRFILRAYSPPLTIAGGRVLDPHPPSVGIRTAAARARLEPLASDPTTPVTNDDRAARALVAEAGILGLPVAKLVTRLGVAPEDAVTVSERLVSTGDVRRVGALLVREDTLADVGERLCDLVGEVHAENPLSEGLPREEARERLFKFAPPAVFEVVVDGLVAAGTLRSTEYLALTAHEARLSPEEERVADRIQALLAGAGLRPPAVTTLGGEIGADPTVMDRILKLLVRQSKVVRVGALVFDSAALATLRSDLQQLRSSEAPVAIDVATFNERYGITRKFAIPLLEYLDRERVTRRMGQRRVLL